MDEKEEEKKEMVSTSTEQVTNDNGATTPQQEDEWSAIETGRETLQKNLDKEIENVRKSQDKERVKEAKKQRNRQIINSIADGISAIANLGGTVHGAPDMSTKSTLTGKSAERYDKIYKDAEEQRKNYLKIVQDQGNENIKNWYTSQKDKLASKQKQQEINIKAQAEARQLADMEFDQALAKAKEERDEKIHALDVESKTYDNDKKKIEAEFTRQKNELEVENLKARKRYYDALTGKAKSDMANAKKSKSSSGGSGGSSSSSKGNYILAVTDKNGVRTSEKIYPWDPRYKQLSIQLDESDDNNNNGGSRISLTDLITHDEGERTMPGVTK